MFASPLKDTLIVLAILLLFFGPKRLPALSRSIGESLKEFKGGVAQLSDEQPEATLAAVEQQASTPAPAPALEHASS